MRWLCNWLIDIEDEFGVVEAELLMQEISGAGTL